MERRPLTVRLEVGDDVGTVSVTSEAFSIESLTVTWVGECKGKRFVRETRTVKGALCQRSISAS